MHKILNLKKNTGINDLVAKAKTQENLKELLIVRYIPFIKKTISQVSGRYITKEDDEHSIGLIAFNEAIDAFDEEKGGSFFSFAGLIIRRRVIDYYRKEKMNQRETNIDSIEHIDPKAVIEEVENRIQTRKDIEDYSKILADFNIRFSDLVRNSPGNRRARENAIRAVQSLLEDGEMVKYLLKRKALPLKQLEIKCNVSRKTLERQRKYIIAVAIIHIYSFESLLEFVPLKQ